MTTLTFHPLSELFPLVIGEEFDQLVLSIRESGQRDPIVLLDGQILDGRNRYRACQAAGVEPITIPFAGNDPVRFVVDKNIRRRHLNESQRALIAAQLVNTKPGANQHVPQGAQICTAEAAGLVNVSRRMVSLARKVLKEATPEEITAVKNGSARVNTLGLALRAGAAPRARMERAANPNHKREQSVRIRSEVWGHLREALQHLGSLPLPSEVASIVRSQDKGGLIDRRLEKSLKWLEDFAHAWRHRDQTAA